jgi:hypothetical protein
MHIPAHYVDQVLDLDHPNREGHEITYTFTNPATAPPGATLSSNGRFQWAVPPDAGFQFWEPVYCRIVVDQAGLTLMGQISISVMPLNPRVETVSLNPGEFETPPLQLQSSMGRLISN